MQKRYHPSAIRKLSYYVIIPFVNAVSQQSAVISSVQPSSDFSCREVNDRLSDPFKLRGLRGMAIFTLHIYPHSAGSKP